jgi:hypothetical protein
MRLLGLTLVLGLALSAAGGAAAATQTIKVTSVTVSLVAHDVKPKGASKGDTVVSRDRLLNAVRQFGKPKGARVGSDSATVTLTSAGAAVIAGHASLPGGTVTLSGEITPLAGGALLVQVTGGTGRYAHVRGTLTVGPGKDHVLNTYRLTTSSGLVA